MLSHHLPLTRSLVDVSSAGREDAERVAHYWSLPQTRVLLVQEGRVRTVGTALEFVSPVDAPAGERYFLGVDGDAEFGQVAYFAIALAPERGLSPAEEVTAEQMLTAPAREHWMNLRDGAATLSVRDAGLVTHAIALANWHRTHRRCSRCGAPTVSSISGHIRRCVVDGSEHFPRTDPAVIMLVIDENDRALLGHNANWPDRRFSTLAGFVEPGETLEGAVAREVFEEAGVVVSATTYAGSQPWPFPSSLMLGFFAWTAPGQDVTPLPDGSEVTQVCWFTREELTEAVRREEVLLPGEISIARGLIETWLRQELPPRRTYG